MRTITHREDELRADAENADVLEEVEDVFSDRMAEGVNERVGEGAGDKVECEVEVGEGEESEEEREELVDEFDVEEDLASDRVVGGPDLFEVYEGVDGGEEGAVEPATTLRDELGYRVCNALDLRVLTI